MKRIISLATAVLLVFVLAGTAGAEGRTVLFFEAAETLLFQTDNVTLRGKAEFRLDGEWFKTAEGTYVQDSDRSFWKLDLTSPRIDGSLRKNGFTVVANGQKIYVMEVFRPGEYRTGTAQSGNSVLRNTVQMEQMVRFARLLAGQAEHMEGITVTEVSEKELRIEVGPDAPALLDTALNLFAEFAARRYFDMDYDRTEAADMVPMSNYITVTEGILASTKHISADRIVLTLKRNGAGDLEQVSGEASLKLETGKDGVRTLDVTFQVDVSGRAESRVKPFDPEDYHVTLAPGAMNVDDYQLDPIDEGTRQMALETAKGFLEKAGLTPERPGMSNVSVEGGRTYVTYYNDDGMTHLTCFWSEDEKLLGLQVIDNDWQGMEEEKSYNYTAYEDGQALSRAKEKLAEFLREVNPDAAAQVKDLALEWWFEKDGAFYAEFHEDPLSQEEDGVLFVVRMAPEWRIEYFSSIANG